jgi:hypothetical protein
VGKVLEAVIASQISYLAEAFYLLLESYYGARKGCSMETTLHVFLEQIYSAWKDSNVVSLLLLDISGAFDTISYKCLLHNLCK